MKICKKPDPVEDQNKLLAQQKKREDILKIKEFKDCEDINGLLRNSPDYQQRQKLGDILEEIVDKNDVSIKQIIKIFDTSLLNPDNFFEKVFTDVKQLNKEVEDYKQALNMLYSNFTKDISCKVCNFLSDLNSLFIQQEKQDSVIQKQNTKKTRQIKAKTKGIRKNPIKIGTRKSPRIMNLKKRKQINKKQKKTLRVNKDFLKLSKGNVSQISETISEVDMEYSQLDSQQNQNVKDNDVFIPITYDEMKFSMFFFQKFTKSLIMVHLDSEYPEIYKTEEVFAESIDIKKQRESFTLLNTPEFKNLITRELEFRHLLIGLNREMNSIYEFVKDQNEEQEIFKLEDRQKFLYNNSVLIHESYLYLIGGTSQQNASFKHLNTCRRFKISIHEETKNVFLEQDESFPNLLRPRKNHSCFVLNRQLFVIFGSQDDIEYVDLSEKELQFRKIPVLNNQSFEKTMIFVDESIENNTRILFFGGNSELIKRGAERQSQLMQLIIYEEENSNSVCDNKRIPVRAILTHYDETVVFEGTPAFNQRLENKKYYKEENTWCFIDENGGFYTLDMTTFETSYEDASKFKNSRIKMESD
eukprot:403350858